MSFASWSPRVPGVAPRPVALALLAVVSWPTLVEAQRRGMGERDVNWNAVAAKKAPPTLAAKDIEELDPLALLVEKKKDLKLTDAQLAALTEAQGKLAADVGPALARIDSLGKAMRPTTSVQGAEDEARMVIARDAAGGAVREVQQRYAAAAEAVMPLLEPPQQEAARKQLEKLQEKGMKTLREKMLGGRGMGGTMGRPPR
jgi:hypothetical protein